MKMKANKILGLIILSMLTTHAMATTSKTNCEDEANGEFKAHYPPDDKLENGRIEMDQFFFIHDSDQSSLANCDNLQTDKNQYCISIYNENMKKIIIDGKQNFKRKFNKYISGKFEAQQQAVGLYKVESLKEITGAPPARCYKFERISDIDQDPSSLSSKFLTTENLDTFGITDPGETAEEQKVFIDYSEHNQLEMYRLQDLGGEFRVTNGLKHPHLYKEGSYVNSNNLPLGVYTVKDTGYSATSPNKDSRLLIFDFEEAGELKNFLTWESTGLPVSNKLVHLKRINNDQYEMFEFETDQGDKKLFKEKTTITVSNHNGLSTHQIEEGLYLSTQLILDPPENIFELDQRNPGPITEDLIELTLATDLATENIHIKDDGVKTLHLERKESSETHYNVRELNADHSIKDTTVAEMSLTTTLATELGNNMLVRVLVIGEKFYILRFENGEKDDFQVYTIANIDQNEELPKIYHFERTGSDDTANSFKLRERQDVKIFSEPFEIEIELGNDVVKTLNEGLHEISRHPAGGFHIKPSPLDLSVGKKFYEFIDFKLNSDTDNLNNQGQYHFKFVEDDDENTNAKMYTVKRVYDDGSEQESGNTYSFSPADNQYPGEDVIIPDDILIVTPEPEEENRFSLAPGTQPTFIEYETYHPDSIPSDFINGKYFIKKVDADYTYEFYHQLTDGNNIGELQKKPNIRLVNSDNGKLISNGLYQVVKVTGNKKIQITKINSDSNELESFIGYRVVGLDLSINSHQTGKTYYVEKKTGNEFKIREQLVDDTQFDTEYEITIEKINSDSDDPINFGNGLYSFTKITGIEEINALHIEKKSPGEFLKLISFEETSPLTEGSFFIEYRNSKYYIREMATEISSDPQSEQFADELEATIESTGINHKTVELAKGFYKFEKDDADRLKMVESQEGDFKNFLPRHTLSSSHSLQTGTYHVKPDGTNKYKFTLRLSPSGRFEKNSIEVTTTDPSDLAEANYEIIIDGNILHYNHIIDGNLNNQRAFQTQLPTGTYHLTLIDMKDHKFLARKTTSTASPFTFQEPEETIITLYSETPIFLTDGLYIVADHQPVINYKSITPVQGQEGAFDSGKFGEVEYTIQGFTTTTIVNIWIKNNGVDDKSEYILGEEKGSYDFEDKKTVHIEKYVGAVKLDDASLKKGLYQVEVGTPGKFKLTILKEGAFSLFQKPLNHASRNRPPLSAFKFGIPTTVVTESITTEFPWKTYENGFYYVVVEETGKIILQKHEDSSNVGTMFKVDVTKFNDREANNIENGYYRIDKIGGKIWMDLYKNGLNFEIHQNANSESEIHEVPAMDERKLIIDPSPETLVAGVKDGFIKFFINNDGNGNYKLYKYDSDTKKVTDETPVQIKERIGDTERSITTVESGLVKIKERSGTNAGTFQLKHLKTGTTRDIGPERFFRVTSSDLTIDETKGAYQIHQKKAGSSNFADSVAWIPVPPLIQDTPVEFWIKKKNMRTFHLYRVDDKQEEVILLKIELKDGTKLLKPNLSNGRIFLTRREDDFYDITVKSYTNVEKKKVNGKDILKNKSGGSAGGSTGGTDNGFSIETYTAATEKFDKNWNPNPSIKKGAKVNYYLKHKNGNIYWLYREDGTQTSATKTKIMKIKQNGGKTSHWHYDGLYKISVRDDGNFKVKEVWWGAIKKKDNKLEEDHYDFYSYFNYDHEEFKMTKLDNSNLDWIKSNHNGNYLVKKLQATNRYRIQKLEDGKVTGDSRVVKIRTMDNFETDFFDGKYKFTKKGDKKFHVEVKWWFDVKQKEVDDKWVLEEVKSGTTSTDGSSSSSAKFDIIGKGGYDFQKTADNNGKFLLLKKNSGNRYQMMKKDGTVVVEVVIKKKNGNFKNNFKAGLYQFTLTNDGKHWKIKNVWKRGLELHGGKLETIGTSLKEHRYKIEKKEGGSWKFIKELDGRFEIKHDQYRVYKIQRIRNGYLVGNKLSRRIQLMGEEGLEKPKFEDGDYKIKTEEDEIFSITFHPRSEIMQKKQPGTSNAVTIPGGGSLLQALSISAPQTMGASDSNILCFRANSQAAQSLLASGAKPIGVEVEVVTPIDASIETDFQHHCETYIVEMRHAHSVAEYDHYLAEYEHYVQEFFHSHPEAHFMYDMPPSCPV